MRSSRSSRASSPEPPGYPGLMGRGVGFMALVAVTAVLAGCGGEAKHSNSVDLKTYPVQTVEVQGNQPRHCKGLSKPKQAAERKRLERDLQQLRLAIKTIEGQAT